MSKSPGGVSVLMRWVGIVAALLSLGSAVYGVLSAQADLREHGREVSEQLAAARTQAAAADYPGAWESLQQASTTAAADGLFAKLLGGLSAQRRAVRLAQQDVAMDWIRDAHAPEGHTFSEIADKVAVVLTQGADAATGSRKADLLAHLGWAYFLKQREGNTELRPDMQYQQALAADPHNPYANAFWGHYVLWHRGPLSEAQTHFSAALDTSRARAVVRELQLAALSLSYNPDLQSAWWRALDEMHKGGEPIGKRWQREMARMYASALEDDSEMRWLLSVIPVADHLELQRMLLDSDPDDKVTVMAAMAVALEASGSPEQAVAEWREMQSLIAPSGTPGATVQRVMNAALLRLKADACKSGYVWRNAGPGDHVCVPPQSRRRVEDENQAGVYRRNRVATQRPDACVAGFVWRDAFDGDHVCVDTDSRNLAKDENRSGPSRRAAAR